MYIDLAMDQNILQFNGKFYHQYEGTAMGNSLSGFLAEICMSFFEIELKDHPLFPRILYRYIDNVFAICSSRKIDATLNVINQCYMNQSNSLTNANLIINYHFWTLWYLVLKIC